MRNIAAVVLASTLTFSAAFAADTAPLAPGKPAGVQQANLSGNGALIFLGLAIVAGGAALVATQGSGNGNIVAATTTTTATSTTTSP